jgi:hypothetical protein
LITATVISKKGIARFETPQYRRDLLRKAVTQGKAWSNSKHHTHNKYGIYFNAKDSVNPAVEITFDPSVLNHINIIDLPPHRIKNGLNTQEIEIWDCHKETWTGIYQLLCGFQIEGKINLNLLPKWYYPHIREEISTKANKLIVIYKILKLGWSELKEFYPSERGYEWSELKEYILSTGEYGYNDMFQRILRAKSIYNFNLYRINLIDRHRTQLDCLRELCGNKDDSEYHENFRKFLGTNYDICMLICNDPIGIVGSDSFIERLFSSTKNTEIRELLVKLNKLGEEINTSCLKSLNRMNDKSRTMKFEEKKLKFLSKR